MAYTGGWFKVEDVAGLASSVEVETTCPYGHCAVFIDATTRRIVGGFGPCGCPCDETPGWRSQFVGGMGKPHPPILPRGRHASRVQRARRRHAYAITPGWQIREAARDPRIGLCRTCNMAAHWVDCPTGGWWAHEVHPADNHDADLPDLEQEMDNNGHLYTVTEEEADRG